MKLSPAIFGALNLANAQRDQWRLPTDLEPLNYNIRIKAFLNPDDQGENEDLSTYPANTYQHFDARAAIKMSCKSATSEIVLNSLFLDFDKSKTSLKKGNKDVAINSVVFDKDLEQVTIKLNEEIKKEYKN